MELWIRSQDKSNLKKVNNIYVEKIEKDFDSWVGNIYSQPYVITSDEGNLGFYATKERALEVLDEIQDKIKTLLYLKPKADLKLDELKTGKRYFENLNGIDFITCDNNFEIEPITTNVIVYEMPEN